VARDFGEVITLEQVINARDYGWLLVGRRLPAVNWVRSSGSTHGCELALTKVKCQVRDNDDEKIDKLDGGSSKSRTAGRTSAGCD
jgi:hypothetical protein